MTLRRTNFAYNGSESVQTASGGAGTQIRRKMFYVNSRDTPDGLEMVELAKKKYLDEFGYEQNLIPGVYLTRLQGRQISKNIVELVAEYTGLQNVVGSGTNLYNFESFTIPTKSFVTQNAQGSMVLIGGQSTSGTFTAEEIAALPTDVVNNPAVRISLQRTIFGINPLVLHLGKIGTLNKFPSTIGGVTFGPGSLLCEGINSAGNTIGTIDVLGQTPANLLLYPYSLSFVFSLEGFTTQFFENGQLRFGNQYRIGDWGFNA